MGVDAAGLKIELCYYYTRAARSQQFPRTPHVPTLGLPRQDIGRFPCMAYFKSLDGSYCLFRILPFIRASLIPQCQEIVFFFHFGGMIIIYLSNGRRCESIQLQICSTADPNALEVNSARVLIRGCKLLRQCFHSDSVQTLRTLARVVRFPSSDASSSAAIRIGAVVPCAHVYDDSLAMFSLVLAIVVRRWLDLPALTRANDMTLSVMCATNRKIITESLAVC
jgi:hypothetical protein